MTLRIPELNLFQKSLILIGVPLLFELGLVGWLYGTLQESEAEVRREQHAKKIILEVDQLISQLQDASKSVVMFIVFKQDQGLEDYRRKTDSVPHHFQELRTELAGDADSLNRLNSLESVGNQIKSSLDKGIELAGQHDRLAGHELFRKLKPVIMQFISEGRGLQDTVRGDLGESLSRQAKTRKNLHVALVVGLIANIAIALILAVFFNRGITRRLAVVVDNTRRLAKGQTLNPSVGGADEIAHLDRVFLEMSEELDKTQRSKQEFVSMVSHDLRAPLTSIQLFVEMLNRGTLGTLTEKGARWAESADRSSDRMLSLINNLLEIDRLESGKIELKKKPVSAKQVCEEAAESVGGLAEKSEIKIEVNAKLKDLVNVEEESLVRVLVNLLGNAIKFSPAGGTVTISAAIVSGMLEICVADQGRGIPENLQENIFDRFKQVEDRDRTEKKGAGLGLAICKAIVLQHDGKIGVRSGQGKGSEFWIQLPLS